MFPKEYEFGVVYASLAGVAAASASLFGKLFSVANKKESDDTTALPSLAGVSCIVLMVLSNGVLWTFFGRALRASRSSLPATIVSYAVNYCCTAIIGWVLFSERTSLIWWIGSTLVLAGLVILLSSSTEKKSKDRKD